MRRIPRALAASAVALAVAASALAQGPPATAPAAPAIPVTKFFPRDGLLAYVEFQGTEAHADAWNATAAAKILKDTPTGAMLRSIAFQWLEANHIKQGRMGPGGTGAGGAETLAFLEQALKTGFATGSYAKLGGAAPTNSVSVTVFRKALRPDAKALAARFIKAMEVPGGKVETVVKPGNRKVVVVSGPDGKLATVWWVENREDLVVADDADAVIAALDGKAPSLEGDAARDEMLKAEDGFQPLGLAWLDVEKFPTTPGQESGAGKFFRMIDVKGVTRIEGRFGTRDRALMHEVRVVAPSPRTGTLALFDGPKLDPKALPPIPEDVVEFGVFTIEPLRIWNQAIATLETANPGARAKLEEAEAAVKARTKLRLKEDILGRLGPKFALYAEPKARTGGLGVQVPKAALLVEIKDAKAVGNLVDQLMIVANKEIKARMTPPAPPGEAKTARRPAPAPAPEFRVTQANPKTYTLNLPGPLAATTNLRLTVAVGKKYLAIATMPDAAKDALAGDAKPSSKGPNEEVARAIEGLPEGLTMLAVSDPRDTLPEGLANLPQTLNALMTAPPAAGAPGPGGEPPPPERGGRPGAVPGGGGRPGVAPGGGGGGDGPPPLIAGANLLQGPPPGPPAGIRVDPANVPSADAIRPLLFPGASAIAVDDRSIRFVSRYAFPNFVDLLGGIAASRNLPALMNGGAGLPPGMGRPGGAPGAGRPGAPAPGGNPAAAPGGRLGGTRPD